jgi:hypothetical protein
MAGEHRRRGYDHRHKLTRRAYLPAAYGQPCARCGETMTEGQDLDLDHTDDRTGYLGFSHRACNRAAGARAANAVIAARNAVDPLGDRSRVW